MPAAPASAATAGIETEPDRDHHAPRSGADLDRLVEIIMPREAGRISIG
jgi:hypothetical protein